MNRLSSPLSALVVALALLAAACGPGENDPEDAEPPADTAPIVEAPSSTSRTAPITVGEPVPVADIDVDLELVATATTPTAMTSVPGDERLAWIAGRSGELFEVDLEQGGDGRPVLDFSDDVSTDGEQGFLGVAAAPDGSHLYTSYTEPDGSSRIDEYEIDGAEIDEGTRRMVFGLPQPFTNHNGGNIVFGPDGFLYFGLGDGGGAGDPDGNGQNTRTLLGSIIRIDPTAQGSQTYGVPDDNPFTDDDGRTEIWLYGVRNPWRFSFDRATGDLWIGDVGQFEIEEIDVLRTTADAPAGRGANLGWNDMEGSRPFEDGTEPPDHVAPIYDYDHSDGNCSVTGGYLYRGDAIPDLVGTYVYGDFCVSELRGLRPSPSDGAEEAGFGIGTDPNTLVSFGEGPDGELYVLASSGEISRIVAG